MPAIFKTTVALAGLALAAAECTKDQKTELEKCQAKVGQAPDDADKQCKWGQDFVACVPCSCEDDEDGIKERITAVKTLVGEDCKIECAGSMLAPGLAALTAAVVALKLM